MTEERVLNAMKGIKKNVDGPDRIPQFINDSIEYDWFNLSTESYKIECKKNIHDLINQQLE